MATVFTHAATAALLSPAAPTGVSPRRLGVALALVAVMPDLDVVAFAFGIPYEHPLGHRGLTHSLPFAVLTGVVVTAVFFRSVPLGSRAGAMLVSLLSVATASHGVLDAMTDGGLGVGFAIPFSNERWFLPWRPLRTSPIGIEAFFGGPVLRILKNEAYWVGLPVLSAFAVWRATHYAVARRGERKG